MLHSCCSMCSLEPWCWRRIHQGCQMCWGHLWAGGAGPQGDHPMDRVAEVAELAGRKMMLCSPCRDAGGVG